MKDAYFAGIFDGEGHIRIAKWHKPNSTHIRYALYGGVGMIDRPVIEALYKEYGGIFQLPKEKERFKNPKHRPIFGWTIASQVAATTLRRFLPYSIAKKEEIEVALEFQAHIDDNPYRSLGGKGSKTHYRADRDEILEFREKLYQKISLLKKRTFPII